MSDNNNNNHSRGRELTPLHPRALRGNSQAMQYADEAAKAAQRHIDMVDQIADLTRELDQMRARSMAAEHENERLLRRERELMAIIDRKSAEFHDERDQVRQTIAVLAAQCNTASKILLESFSTIEKLEGIKAKIPRPHIDAEILAEQINDDQEHERGPDRAVQD
jgi:ABC-type phosphate transport system auxiliary subunit